MALAVRLGQTAGSDALVARFGAGLPVTLSTPVRRIRWDGPAVAVETAKDLILRRHNRPPVAPDMSLAPADGSDEEALPGGEDGAPISPEPSAVRGGEPEAFRMLDALQVMKLAVSLGGTETLISHPASTTHSGVAKETRDRMGVTDALILEVAHGPHREHDRGGRVLGPPVVRHRRARGVRGRPRRAPPLPRGGPLHIRHRSSWSTR